MLHYLKSIRNFEKSKRYLSDTYMNSNLIDKILNEISLDSRIPDGTFRIEEDSHMEVLREYFTSKGIDESLVIEYSNRVLEGKYPERQAYNAKGILVTFPTPEYKADAIKRGTHFEEDPTKQAQNIFQTSTPAAAPKQPTKPAAGGDTKTSLPMSQTSTQPEPTANPSPAAPTATPQPTPQPEIPQTVVAPQPSPEEEKPVVEPTKLPPPEIAPPEEKEANKNAIKKMLKGDDYMLEEISEWVMHNAPEHIKEHIKMKI